MLSKIISRKAAFKGVTQANQKLFSNSVYLWSAGQAPRLGPKAGNIRQQMAFKRGVPERVEFFDKLNVQTLRIGIKHSAVISEDGGLYMFGGGNWGVLGQGNETDIPFKEPKRVEKFDKLGLKVVDIALGECHSFALTDDGSLWTWGYGGKKGMFNWMYTQEVGALGHGDKEAHMMPKRVQYFKDHNIKVKSISAGLYHCNVLTEEGSLYTWGRGLYGVLGHGSNAPELSPVLNEDVQLLLNEDPTNQIVRMDSADEFTVIQQRDGTLHAWGKNDRGQMGTPVGIGMDMIECENVPTQVVLVDDQQNPRYAKQFAIGQNTQIIQDTENDIFLVGLKLHYNAQQVNFDPEFLDKNNVDQIACGRKHYIITTTDKKLLAQGNVFKEKDQDQYSEGFFKYDTDLLFDDGKVKQLEVKYAIFAALIEH